MARERERERAASLKAPYLANGAILEPQEYVPCPLGSCVWSEDGIGY